MYGTWLNGGTFDNSTKLHQPNRHFCVTRSQICEKECERESKCIFFIDTAEKFCTIFIANRRLSVYLLTFWCDVQLIFVFIKFYKSRCGWKFTVTGRFYQHACVKILSKSPKSRSLAIQIDKEFASGRWLIHLLTENNDKKVQFTVLMKPPKEKRTTIIYVK